MSQLRLCHAQLRLRLMSQLRLCHARFHQLLRLLLRLARRALLLLACCCSCKYVFSIQKAYQGTHCKAAAAAAAAGKGRQQSTTAVFRQPQAAFCKHQQLVTARQSVSS
jgi:hypothetical protein